MPVLCESTPALKSDNNRRRKPKAKRKMKWCVALVIFFFMGPLLLVIGWGVGATISGNASLEDRIWNLEVKLAHAQSQIHELSSNMNYHHRHPTKESRFFTLEVLNFNSSLRTSFSSVFKTFEAGETLGPEFISEWTLYLSESRGEIGVHLALDKWSSKASALFVGLTAEIEGLDSKSLPVSNLFAEMNQVKNGDEEWQELAIPDFTNVSKVFNQLSNRNATELKIRIKFSLMGHGHLLYSEKLGDEKPAKDKQIVDFFMDGNRTQVSAKFDLIHPWSVKSRWVADVRRTRFGIELVAKLLQVEEEEEEKWDQFFTSFTALVKAGNSSKTLTSPISDYILNSSTSLTFTGVGISNTSQTNLEITLEFTTFNRNARYYVNLKN